MGKRLLKLSMPMLPPPESLLPPLREARRRNWEGEVLGQVFYGGEGGGDGTGGVEAEAASHFLPLPRSPPVILQFPENLPMWREDNSEAAQL